MPSKPRYSHLIASTALVFSAFAASPALASETPPEFTEEGLALVHESEWGLVYAEPGADLSGYNKVQILDTYVAFRKNWQRDQNRSTAGTKVRESDMERIKTSLAAEFNEVFSEVLQENDGYPVVDAAGADVLLLRPAIINLNVAAPDLNRGGMNRSYAESAGDMTIYLEIYDSVTGHLIAKGMDRKADMNTGFMTWQNSVQNKQAARRILKGWAGTLRDALDRAHQGAPAAD